MDGVICLTSNDKGNKILLVKRRDYPIWVMPGGGIEKIETPKKAATRETFEESGFNVKIVRKIAEYSAGGNRISHFYLCKIVSGKPRTSRESSKVSFFSPKHLPNPISPLIANYIDDFNKRHSMVIKKSSPKLSGLDIVKFIIFYPLISIRFLLTKIGIRINI
ncbi:MAG TPA: NUDIX hydrolase [Patescibacteria group bacterium]|nr:NUDIX hydrolase [Patescibacteria group bacterium]